MPSPKERLLTVLTGGRADRPPVICPGGMMNTAIVEIMQLTGHTLPAAHGDAGLMADLASDIFSHTGFENLGVPFCLTVEAEVLGSEITYGTLACEPKVVREVYPSAAAVRQRPIESMLRGGRIPVILQAIEILARRHRDVAIIGNLTGPVSTAASLVDPVNFLKELRKKPVQCHEVLNYVTDLLIGFAQKMVQSGATLIAISDPTATGEILGPKIFAAYAVRYLSRITAAMHQQNVPVIVHICGNLQTARSLLPEIKADAISTDALVNLPQLKAELPGLTTMGNLSTYMLELGTAEAVAARARQLVSEGIDIIAPACGLSTSTPLGLIRAMTAAVKGE